MPRVLCAIANIVSGRLQLNFFMYLLQPDEHEKVKRVPCLLEVRRFFVALNPPTSRGSV